MSYIVRADEVRVQIESLRGPQGVPGLQGPAGAVDKETEIDATLTKEGTAADAKATGDAIVSLNEENEVQAAMLAGMSIEGFERTGSRIDIKGSAEKYEGAYMTREWDNATSKYVIGVNAISSWNYYILNVSGGEKIYVNTLCGGGPPACCLVSSDGTVVSRHPATIPSGSLVQYVEEIAIPDGVTMLYCNEVPSRQSAELKRVDTSIPTFRPAVDYGKSSDQLFGKKLACVGDSITEATNPDGGYFTNYAEIVAARHAMTVYKDGKGGSTMANSEGYQPFCADRYLAVPEYDILTIFFGWNDATYSTLGSINDTADTTFYGAYKKVLDHFITAYPTKKIGLIVPYGNESIKPLQEAIRALSEMYGVPCLDLADGRQCSLLWGMANAAQLARRAALTYDGTHPNQEGHEYLATMYEAFIQRL